MGYTVQLQWSFTPPPGRSISLADIVLPRVLEHYGLHTPSRTALQFRTYRAQFPSSDPSSPPTSRYLTTITSLSPPTSNAVASTSASGAGAVATRDDVTYLFLDDRSIPSSSATQVVNDGTLSSSNDIGASSSTPMVIDVTSPDTKTSALGENGNVQGQGTMDEDGFEIIDIPPGGPNASSAQQGSTEIASQIPEGPSTSTGVEAEQTKEKLPKRFRCLAVRPSGAVVPMLQSLLSPFVMGLTKAARATATSTASTAIPTPLPGTSLLLTTLTFPPLSSPLPPIILRVYIVPNPLAQSIFLEAEYQSSSSVSSAYPESGGLSIEQRREQDMILREFLEGCLVDEIGGEKKFVSLSTGSEDETMWEGVDRGKKAMFALAKTLRESGFI
ncbi:hypothetical protein CI109_107271 [Kwoniella shandongensis]|uniref:Uncharacterized protein n=1 Tax=Kwoniella shandongensis TaxID=1734106 RepID=A0A5M6C617_9TREE|nr:uncharacterized protein CI109_002553 [Kwoniella shandongensis]KAA5529212.1 hypothetical protein CI109_002553 [Kwoniella shandongensis]